MVITPYGNVNPYNVVKTVPFLPPMTWEWEVYTTYENGDDWRNGKHGIVLPALSKLIQLWAIINNPT